MDRTFPGKQLSFKERNIVCGNTNMIWNRFIELFSAYTERMQFVDFVLLATVIAGAHVLTWNILLHMRIRRLYEQIRRLKQKIAEYLLTDPLTGLYSYKYFIRRLRENISQSQRTPFAISLVKIDIELFRNINTIYGIPEGDIILKEFAQFLKNLLRSCDVVARLKDEEFGIILSHTSRDQARRLGKRIKQSLRENVFGKKCNITIRISMGIVTLPQDGESEISLLCMLDRCLLRSKECGAEIITPLAFKDPEGEPVSFSGDDEMSSLKNKISLIHRSLGKTALESIICFSNAIKAKDLYTGEHTAKTRRIAVAIGRKIGLNPEQIERLRYASILHDLGKVGIPERILTKPGRLTHEEFEKIKKHPGIGAEILRPLHELSGIIPPILYHHEWVNGDGYPCGLILCQIPIEAKIVAVADSFQALVSNRPYRQALSCAQALRILDEESGTHFDPAIVNAFKSIAGGLIMDA